MNNTEAPKQITSQDLPAIQADMVERTITNFCELLNIDVKVEENVRLIDEIIGGITAIVELDIAINTSNQQ
jgi:hypothetical protein